MVFEEPVAHVDCQVDLLALDDLEFALVLLHVDRHEFVADFRGMLSRIHETELLLFQLIQVFRLGLVVALASLLPADFIEAFSEEDHKGEHGAVERVVHLLAHCVQVQGKDLINEHAHLLCLTKVKVVALPPLLLPVQFSVFLVSVILVFVFVFLFFVGNCLALALLAVLAFVALLGSCGV